MPLTAEVIENLELRGRPYKLHDGGGMFLLVTPSGGKWWRIKYRIGGKENQLSLGVYPNVSLAEARGKRADLRALLADGIDPSAARKAERAGRIAEEIARRIATRFTLDSHGALSVILGNRRIELNPYETSELRAFLMPPAEYAEGDSMP